MTSPAASSQSSFKTAEDADNTGFNADEAEAVQPTDEEPKTPTKVIAIHADPEPSENRKTDPPAEQKQQESSKPTGDAEPDADADASASTPQPQPPTLPVLTPLPPLPSVPSDGSMSDMLSAVATIGSDPPAASSTSSIAPHDSSFAAAQAMTEAEVDAAINAEMAELKAEIAELRTSIGDNDLDRSKEEGGEGEDVLRMAEFKLDYVEKSMRRL